MDIKALQRELRKFAAARNWQPFHTPKNLSSALMVEAAELVEIFQWLTPEQSQAAHLSAVTQERIADEVADVLLYLLQMADHCAIDLPKAVASKLQKNAVKHPPAVQIEPAPAVNPEPAQPPTHVLVDWENVQPKDQDIQKLVPGVTDVWVFHGQNQKNVAAHQRLWGQRVTLVPIERPGKNALDFHLSFYIGYIASRSPTAHFVVISNDQGYGPMLEHAGTLGFSVQQIGFQKAPAPAKKVGTHKASAVAPKKIKPAPKPTKKPAPAKKATLPGPQAAAVASVSPLPDSVKKAPAAKKASAAHKTPAAKKTPTAKKASTAASKTARPTATAATKAADTGPKPMTEQDQAKALAHVRTSLKKMTAKPSRKSSLVAAIKSLLKGVALDASIVSDVLTELEKTNFVVISGKGQVSYPVAT